MLVSLIYAACNQGDLVRKTIPLARESLADVPHEIIVVDDQSIDGCCHGLASHVLIVRTEQRVGVSAARRIGVTKSRGDLLLFSDPHCEYPSHALARLVQLATINRAIVQPPTKSRPQSSRVAYGGRLENSERGIVVRTSQGQAQACPALINTIYALRRDVYDAIGGWPELPGCWGYSEQAMTLLAWSCGVPILVADTDVCVHYAYQVDRRLPYFTSVKERAINGHYVHAAFFPTAYNNYWRALLDARFGHRDECQAALRERGFRNLRRQLQQHAVVRDEHQLLQHITGLGALNTPSSPQDEALVSQQRARSIEIGSAPSRPRLRRTLNWFKDVIPGCLKGRAVLDCGSHDGLACEYLQRLEARHVEGVELVPELAERAKQLGRPIRCGDFRHLADLPGSWDIVTCIHALEHVPDPELALDEMVRVLRPGGWLLIVVPREAEARTEWAHNCAFPDSRALKRLIRRNRQLQHASIRIKVAKYTNDDLEIRLAVRKKNSGG